MMRAIGVCVVLAAATGTTPVRTPLVDKWATGAQLFDGLGPLHRAVTTGSPEAQRYFDQGLRLTYGFNHDEAARSFARAAELDPRCASCFWGVALTMGPNYNVPMLPERAAIAWEALERAKALAPSATPVEQALIGALAKRYGGPEPLDPKAMQPYSAAYAAAMREVAAEHPDDVDVMVLTAEALMDVQPWKLWTLDGKPAKDTPEIVRLLEAALAKDVNHPGANHYYIHAVESSPTPARALPSAERLGALMPAAGHIVHMPAHIFQRVGRYADASESNRRAIEADRKYLALTKPPGYYPMYIGHNYGFLAYSAAMEGRGAETIAAARGSARALPPEMIAMMPGMDYFPAEPLLAMVRFARWDELLAEPRPAAKWATMTALWLHAHGMALAAKGRLAEAAREHAELLQVRAAMPAELKANNGSARDVAALAAKILEARIAEGRKSPRALGLWREAVALEDGMPYAEPAEWFYPVRHFYGAALLEAGRAREAEAVYREDLRRNPRNGWGLFGLAAALRAQGRDASAVERDLAQAWSRADVKLNASIL